jgi:hypothetical protein
VCLLVSPAWAEESMPHVRGTSGHARWLIEMALTYSATVSALASTLARSDVVVYVRTVPLASGTAKTVLLNGHGPVRYLLIAIDSHHAPDVLVEMLGHELQHAVEIAGAPDVRNEAGIVALYRRIGLRPDATTSFETLLAQEMGRRARRDLINRPAALWARGSQ